MHILILLISLQCSFAKQSINQQAEKVVKASEIWNTKQMQEMLGINSADDVNNKHSYDVGAIPSLLTALKESAQFSHASHLPTVCRLPGYKGNVVRHLRNKGSLICHTKGFSLLKTRFDIQNSLPAHESVTQSSIKLRLLNLDSAIAPIFQKGSAHVKILGYKSPATRFSAKDCMQKDSTEMNFYLQEKFGNPIFTLEHRITSSNVIEIGISQLIKTHHERRSREFACLVFIESISGGLGAVKPSLFVVSVDKRQCPMHIETSAGNDEETSIAENNILLARSKRDVPTQYPLESDEDTIKNTAHSKRSATRSSICKEHPMWVSFEDMEWGKWIIAPRGFHANICQGECPFPLGDKLNGTNHAVLMTLMNTVEPEAPLPCCVPTHLTPISLLYFDSGGNVVLRQYEDMVVKSCGCR